MQYIVVTSLDVVGLTKAVEDNLSEGWTLHGGIATPSDSRGRPFFMQAMARDTNEKQPGDALTDDLDGALDCLYTKAMRDRDLNGPDAYAISQAYDLVRRSLTTSDVPPEIGTLL